MHMHRIELKLPITELSTGGASTGKTSREGGWGKVRTQQSSSGYTRRRWQMNEGEREDGMPNLRQESVKE